MNVEAQRSKQLAHQANTRDDKPGKSPQPIQATTPIGALVANFHFLLLFSINQLGSVLYLRCLTLGSLSLVMPTVNALAFVTTAIMDTMCGHSEIRNQWTFSGISLVLIGMYFTLT